MTPRDAEDFVRRFFRLWEAKDRAGVADALTESFTFSSPYDDRIDRRVYFERCWPNADRIRTFELESVVADGSRVFVQYVATRATDGTRFRNTEVFTLAGDKLDEVNVFFGRDLDERPAEARGATGETRAWSLGLGKVVVDLTLSVDGFIAGPNDGRTWPLGQRAGEHLFDWFATVEQRRAGELFAPKADSRIVVDELARTTGAMLTGRRTYDVTNGWNGTHPMNGIPVVILTHAPPRDVPQGKSRLVFVSSGIEAGVAKAKELAGDKNVTIGGASAAQQALAGGLVDEVVLHVAPYLLGDGVRLFDHLGDHAIRLRRLALVDAEDATHVRYRVLRRGDE